MLFDIGHGKGSFAFKTARAMLANGFYPDTISSDIHALCIDGPAFDQVTTMSKFLCMGMPLPDVMAASTVNAAMALRRPELGSLKPGSVGDATLISIQEGRFDYVDVVGEHLFGDRKIVSEGVVIGGRWWHPKNHQDSGSSRANAGRKSGRSLEECGSFPRRNGARQSDGRTAQRFFVRSRSVASAGGLAEHSSWSQQVDQQAIAPWTISAVTLAILAAKNIVDANRV